MERERLKERARERLRKLRRPPKAAPENPPDPPATAAPAKLEGDSDPFSGMESLSLGDLEDSRREAFARRVRRLRGLVPALLRPRRPAKAAKMFRRSRPPMETSYGAQIEAQARRFVDGAVDRGRAVGHAGTDLAHGASHAWHGLPLIARQRIAAGTIVAALLAILLLVIAPAAPCGVPGGDDCPPTDEALAMVPGDALAYAHIDIDASSEQFAAASRLASRIPQLTGFLVGVISNVGGGSIDFDAQIRPWAGDEAAAAVLPGSGRLDRVTMIAVDDADGARAFAAGLLGPAATVQTVNGIEVSAGPGNSDDSAAALVDGFLLLGNLEGVSLLIDPDADGGKLATSEAADAIGELPEDRFAYAYLSGGGASALLSDPRAAPLDTFINSAASRGVAAALSVQGDVASLTVRSTLTSTDASTLSGPGFFSALPPFEPELTADVGAGALAYLGLGDPASSITALLSEAAVDTPALASAFDRAAEGLSRNGAVGVADDLLPLLGSEAAISVQPVAGDTTSQVPGVITPSGVPYVSLIAGGVDSAAAASALANLQPSLVSALTPESGEVAGSVAAFQPLQIAGIEAQSLTVGPNVQLTYATYDDRLVVATDPLGIAQARAGGEGLAQSPAFREVTAGLPQEVSALAYLDLTGLISLGEQIGLAEDPAYATLAPDLRALDAGAIAVNQSDGVIRTDLNLSVGAPDPAPVEIPPLAGE